MERPEKWEIVCERCLRGYIASDAWVERNVRNENVWPKCCGKIMLLRRVHKEQNYCNDTSCQMAQYGVCGCKCGGKFHGVNNPNPHFTKVTLVPKWYYQPISELIAEFS